MFLHFLDIFLPLPSKTWHAIEFATGFNSYFQRRKGFGLSREGIENDRQLWVFRGLTFEYLGGRIMSRLIACLVSAMSGTYW